MTKISANMLRAFIAPGNFMDRPEVLNNYVAAVHPEIGGLGTKPVVVHRSIVSRVVPSSNQELKDRELSWLLSHARQGDFAPLEAYSIKLSCGGEHVLHRFLSEIAVAGSTGASPELVGLAEEALEVIPVYRSVIRSFVGEFARLYAEDEGVAEAFLKWCSRDEELLEFGEREVAEGQRETLFQFIAHQAKTDSRVYSMLEDLSRKGKFWALVVLGPLIELGFRLGGPEYSIGELKAMKLYKEISGDEDCDVNCVSEPPALVSSDHLFSLLILMNYGQVPKREAPMPEVPEEKIECFLSNIHLFLRVDDMIDEMLPGGGLRVSAVRSRTEYGLIIQAACSQDHPLLERAVERLEVALPMRVRALCLYHEFAKSHTGIDRRFRNLDPKIFVQLMQNDPSSFKEIENLAYWGYENAREALRIVPAGSFADVDSHFSMLVKAGNPQAIQIQEEQRGLAEVITFKPNGDE